jgi:hypothetical protein
MKITNTTSEIRRSIQRGGGLAGIGLAMMATAGSIEASEAKGQLELAASSQLPTKMPPSDRAALEKMGVQFKGQTAGDDLFTDVVLPKGWKIKPNTGSSYWSDLVNDKNQVVGSMFYKAAHYDRDAFFNLKK